MQNKDSFVPIILFIFLRITLLFSHFSTITEKKWEAKYCDQRNAFFSVYKVKIKPFIVIIRAARNNCKSESHQESFCIYFTPFSLGLEWAHYHLMAANQIVVLGLHPWFHRNRVPLSLMLLPQKIAVCIKFYYFFLIKDATFYQMTVHLIQKTLSWHQNALIRNCLL